jgi:putative SOS response-associated peptidase YedK
LNRRRADLDALSRLLTFENRRLYAAPPSLPPQLSRAAAFHNRMPVVLKPQAWPIWLGEEPANASELKALLAPFPSEEMACWAVSPRVGNVKNNDASLIEPIAA